MLGRRGWIYVVAALVALAVTYTAIVHHPVDTLRQTLRAHSFKPKPWSAIPPAVSPESSSFRDGLEAVLGPLREYEDGFT